MVSCLGVKKRFDLVVPGRIEALDASEFGKPARRSASREDGDQVDRLGDHHAGHGDDGFLDEDPQTIPEDDHRKDEKRDNSEKSDKI